MFPFHLLAIRDDGRYLAVKGTLEDSIVTFTTVYFPNRNHAPLYFPTDKLYGWHACIEGDLNAPLEPLFGTSDGKTSLLFRTLKYLRLASPNLYDFWTTLNPRDQDYMYYSALHSKYTLVLTIY